MMEKGTILVFAPHPDDEVLGCGGTIAKRVSQGYKVVVCLATRTNEWEQRIEEMHKADEWLGVSNLELLMLPELNLDRIDRCKLNGKILSVVERYAPTEVYIPYRKDLHTDHRELAEAVIIATRPKYSFTPKRVYAYETLSETGWNYLETENSFSPNVYENIEDTIEKKLEALSLFESQMYSYPSCRSVEAIKSLAIYRGTQAEMKYAESFMLVREYK